MAMRKVFYGPEGIMLSHVLRMYDKESLLVYARELQIRRTTGLKKDELAEKIANELLSPSVMRRRLATFTTEQRALLERAIQEPFVPTEDEMDDALALHEKDYAFLNRNNQLNVPVDVGVAYEKINTPEFRQYAKKVSWLSQCLYFGENIYGVFDKGVLLQMYNNRRGYHISRDELDKMCNEFPMDMMGCHIEEEREIIIAEYLAYSGGYVDLLDIQAKKVFYIPTSDQVLDFYKHIYLSETPAYKELRHFFKTQMGLSEREADDEAADVWDKVQERVDFPDILKYFVDFYRDIMDEPRVRRLLELLQNAHNNTRLQMHRGHTPNEMMQIAIEQGNFVRKPTIVPGSAHAANLLKGASAELQAMGLSVDFNSNAVTMKDGTGSKKVYPNDPCPCGSGKKFKKCCGR